MDQFDDFIKKCAKEINRVKNMPGVINNKVISKSNDIVDELNLITRGDNLKITDELEKLYGGIIRISITGDNITFTDKDAFALTLKHMDWFEVNPGYEDGVLVDLSIPDALILFDPETGDFFNND